MAKKPPLDALNQHIPGLDLVERRLRLPELLDAKLVYAASVHKVSPSELLVEVLEVALKFDMPAVPFVRPAAISIEAKPPLKHSA